MKEDILAYVRHGMDMSEKVEGGTMQEVLEGIVRSPFASIERIEEAKQRLIPPPLPSAGTYLLVLFRKAQERRSNSGMGLNPIDFRDFYGRRGVRLAGWEIDVLESLDLLVINNANEIAEKKTQALEQKTANLPSPGALRG